MNATTREHWDAFAGHRRNVSARLGAGGAPRPTRLCVVGAGNANDLDLPALLEAHREVHLVDLDAEALALGAGRQGVAGHPGLRLHGGIDATGMLDAMAAWSPWTSVTPADRAALTGWPAGRVALALPGGFDLVASTCLLTQLMESARHALGAGHFQLVAVERAIRAGHLRLLDRLAAPGGRACLITEVASSDAIPGLGEVPEADLPGLLRRLAPGSGHFRGVHPAELAEALRDARGTGPNGIGWEPTRPWRWHLHARAYLVWAMAYRVGGPSAAGR
ncbi:hypothetical protein TA3x_005753 (plasmid) [Tundrisphaera sp. TA3]|uniref:hypothetical protein n=1 Tax=Tundrisphaera sp. TA3 TaxID=3435775 RepID=UPI003EC0E16E